MKNFKKSAFIFALVLLGIGVILMISSDFQKSQQKEKFERSKFIQDSTKTDSAFRSSITLLTQASDSLLPYVERKQFKDTMNKWYKEFVLQRLHELKKDWGMDSASCSQLAWEHNQHILKEDGYGPDYVGKEYSKWVTKTSKNPMRQWYLEDKISQKQAEYRNFRNAKASSN